MFISYVMCMNLLTHVFVYACVFHCLCVLAVRGSVREHVCEEHGGH